MAPVLPAETIALTSPPAIRPQHLEIELSRFFRSASTGLSSMPITWLACTIGSRSREAVGTRASSCSIRSRSPTSTTVNSGWSTTASQAPVTIGPGAKSPPIASKATRIASLAKCLIPASDPGSVTTQKQAPGRRKSRREARLPHPVAVRGSPFRSGQIHTRRACARLSSRSRTPRIPSVCSLALPEESDRWPGVSRRISGARAVQPSRLGARPRGVPLKRNPQYHRISGSQAHAIAWGGGPGEPGGTRAMGVCEPGQGGNSAAISNTFMCLGEPPRFSRTPAWNRMTP